MLGDCCRRWSACAAESINTTRRMLYCTCTVYTNIVAPSSSSRWRSIISDASAGKVETSNWQSSTGGGPADHEELIPMRRRRSLLDPPVARSTCSQSSRLENSQRERERERERKKERASHPTTTLQKITEVKVRFDFLSQFFPIASNSIRVVLHSLCLNLYKEFFCAVGSHTKICFCSFRIKKS